MFPLRVNSQTSVSELNFNKSIKGTNKDFLSKSINFISEDQMNKELAIQADIYDNRIRGMKEYMQMVIHDLRNPVNLIESNIERIAELLQIKPSRTYIPEASHSLQVSAGGTGEQTSANFLRLRSQQI